MRVMLVASAGGHLAQLLALSRWWGNSERIWVTFDTGSAIAALRDENVVWAHHPTTRHLGNAVRNLALACQVLRQHRPDLVVSTGAGVAAPFFLAAHALGIRTVFIEVVDRITSRTLTGRLVYPFTDEFVVQWEVQRQLYPAARVIGPTL